jgi:pyridoxal phosphate enzyme (YggS family)
MTAIPLLFLQNGQRYFGENYAQELMTKANEMPVDVSWHFIGPLQSNKAAPLVKAVGLGKLACIETVSTIKLAEKLNRVVEAINEDVEEKKKLGIYIQVNTSGEDSKSGVSQGGELAELVKKISEECSWISIDGLMTIGAPGDDSCFDTLRLCRDEVASVLDRDPNGLELSMGMSGDFEVAIAKGATSVRVGSTIFGDRDYSK